MHERSELAEISETAEFSELVEISEVAEFSEVAEISEKSFPFLETFQTRIAFYGKSRPEILRSIFRDFSENFLVFSANRNFCDKRQSAEFLGNFSEISES
jgi:hypothetical protein